MHKLNRMRLAEVNLVNESRKRTYEISVIYYVEKSNCKRIACLQVRLLSALKYWAEFVITEVFHVRFYLWLKIILFNIIKNPV